MKQKRLTIGLVSDDGLDRADGVQQHIKLLGSWLESRGHLVFYIAGQTQSTRLGDGAVYSPTKSIAVQANQNQLTIPLPVSNIKIRAILDETKPDVLHIMLPFSPFLGRSVLQEADRRSIPYIGTFHTLPATLVQRMGSALYGTAIRSRLQRFKTLLSVSEATQTYVQEKFGVTSDVVPNFIDVARFSSAKSQAKIKTTPHTVVFVNRMVTRKGPQHLLEVIRVLHEQSKLDDTHVYMCGKGPLRDKLIERTASYGLDSVVTFPGFISEEEKAQYLASADVAMYPATGGEAFGIVLLEAMSAGALTFGGNNPGYASVLGQSPDLLFEPRDYEHTADQLYRLLHDAKLRTRLLTWQRAHVTQYDIAQVGPDIEQYYLQAALR